MTILPQALSFDDVLLIPRKGLSSRAEVSLTTSVCGLELRLPILSANMASVTGPDMVVAMSKAGGIGVLDRIGASYEEQLESCIQLGYDGIPFIASIGVTTLSKECLGFVKAGAYALCVDVAHAHQDAVLSAVLRALEVTGAVVVGNIATGEAARFLVEGVNNAGYNLKDRMALKVGIGSGSLCSTRVRTGFGLPTLESLFRISEVLDGYDSPPTLIADGGIRTSGDIVKCLAAGADAVMLGSVLAGTAEAPGAVIKDDRTGTLCKVYRGNASFGAKKAHGGEAHYIEGAETLVPYKGHVADVLSSLEEGMRSGFSYGGARNIRQLQLRADFIGVTNSGLHESLPHGLLGH